MNLLSQLKKMENRSTETQIKSNRIMTERSERLPSEREVGNPFRRMEQKKFQLGLQRRLEL